MIKSAPEIVLFQPEIPQNVGAIARLVAGACARLHLIQPFAFGSDDKQLLRPGLDYWPYLDLEIHPNLERILQAPAETLAFFSAHADKDYSEIPTGVRFFVFGRETSGLSPDIHLRYPKQLYRIPILHPEVRSLNLANAVSIVLYDQMKQRGISHA